MWLQTRMGPCLFAVVRQISLSILVDYRSQSFMVHEKYEDSRDDVYKCITELSRRIKVGEDRRGMAFKDRC